MQILSPWDTITGYNDTFFLPFAVHAYIINLVTENTEPKRRSKKMCQHCARGRRERSLKKLTNNIFLREKDSRSAGEVTDERDEPNAFPNDPVSLTLWCFFHDFIQYIYVRVSLFWFESEGADLREVELL